MKELSTVGICVDVDGTLYSVSKWKIAWKLRKRLALLRTMYRTREEMRTDAAAFLTHQDFLETEAQKVAEKLMMSPSEVSVQLADLKSRLVEVMTLNARPFAGVLECLEWAVSNGAVIAVLSDYAPREKLENLGLDELDWSGRIGAEECGALKPNSAGFDAVKKKCGENISTWIYIGDRVDTDILGAKSSGFVPILFSSDKTSEATYRIKNWKLASFQSVIGEILASEA